MTEPNPGVREPTAQRVGEILEAVAGTRVLVVGDLMIDRYVSGAVDRISPEAPVPVVLVDEERSAIGGAGNVAANVSALGAECVIAGCVGDDGAGDMMRDELRRLGVSVEGVVTAEDRPTTVKTRVTSRRQQIVRFDREDESDVPAAVARSLTERIESLAAQCHVLVMEDYNKGVLVPEVIAAVLGSAEREGGLPTVVDPKRRNFFAYGGATVFKPNAKELADALGEFIHPDEPEWMERTRRRLECRHLLLTLGDRGIALQSDDDGHLRVPTVARSVYDVSGAGDTVTAVVAAALAAGGSISEAAVVANHAAAVEVSKSGVATVSPQEILQHVRSHQA
ncbi:MAG: bifunctional ADP-heptose synthase [Longimicrobiales bacterium]|nr:bifunctional ADP-heptose synthase [Longimicrobiales bacterium]